MNRVIQNYWKKEWVIVMLICISGFMSFVPNSFCGVTTSRDHSTWIVDPNPVHTSNTIFSKGFNIIYKVSENCLFLRILQVNHGFDAWLKSYMKSYHVSYFLFKPLNSIWFNTKSKVFPPEEEWIC